MSRQHENEIRAAATRAAIEAAVNERRRCLWLLERLVQEAAKGIDSKVIPAAELQMVKVRFELTRSIVKAAKALILSNIRPQPAQLTPAKIVDTQLNLASIKDGHTEPPASEIVVP